MTIKNKLIKFALKKHIGKQPTDKPHKSMLSNALKRVKFALFGKKWYLISESWKWLKKMPFPISFVIFMLFLFFTVGYWNSLRAEKWTETLRLASPEGEQDSGEYFLTPVYGKKVGLSVMDLVIAEWNSKINGFFWVLMNSSIILLFTDIWKNVNPRKPLSLPIGNYRRKRGFT